VNLNCAELGLQSVLPSKVAHEDSLGRENVALVLFRIDFEVVDKSARALAFDRENRDRFAVDSDET
jgi:hypothetical protein